MTFLQFIGFLIGVSITGVIVLAAAIISYEVSERRRIRESQEWWANALRKQGISEEDLRS